MSNFKKSSKVAAICIAAVAVIGVVGSMAYISHQKKMENIKATVEVDTIYDGVSVAGIDVSGKTKEEAQALLKEQLRNALDAETIVLKHGDKEWELPYRTFEAKYDIEQAVEDAYQVARSGELEQRYQQIAKMAKGEGIDIEAAYQYDAAKIAEAVKGIENEVKQEAVDATIKRENGQFVITDEQDGYNLDEEKTIGQVESLVKSKKPGEITIAVVETKPKVTREMCEMSTDLLGSFSTSFSQGAVGRNENLRVGCANINGTVVAPGEVFSMNVGLGPQTYENGYRNAAVIVNGKIEDGLAGGVCQITTTLYNAVIFSELEVVERANHSLAVAYVPLGRDAAVAGDYKDLKFRNTTEYPIFIEAFLSGNNLICNIYGHETRDPGRTVEFEKVYVGSIPKPAEKVTLDPNMPEGEREVTYTGKIGSKVSTYKLVYQNGNLVSREWFSDSTYRATADEVTVGTKKVEAAPAAAVDQPGETQQPAESAAQNLPDAAAGQGPSAEVQTPPAEATPPAEEPTETPAEQGQEDAPIGAE